MRWLRVVSFALFSISLCTAALLGSCAPSAQQPTTATPAAMTPEQKVERGHYLVTICGCNDCHTPGTLYGAPDTTRVLSGSELGWRGPWGVTFPRNLTPDSTGIGAWSEDQIVVAIREGRRPDGSPLLPPMPWPMYAHLTDDDAHAIAAYVKSLPAVAHVNLKQLRPNEKFDRPAFNLPMPPPAWDGRNLPPPGGAAKAGG